MDAGITEEYRVVGLRDCKHISDFRVLWQDSRACWARKLAITSRSLSAQDRIISSSILCIQSQGHNQKLALLRWNFELGIVSSPRLCSALTERASRRPHSASHIGPLHELTQPAADLVSIGELVQRNPSPYPALSIP